VRRLKDQFPLVGRTEILRFEDGLEELSAVENDTGPHNGESPKESAQIYRVQVLERTFAILDLLAEQNSGVNLAFISRKLGLNKTTVLRLLTVLESHRYVERNGTLASYRLGSKLFELGTKAVAKLDILERARPFLRGLVGETGETSHLAMLRDGEVISLANRESPRTLRTPSTVGGRSPAHCTSVGKAILAFRPDTEVDEMIRTRGLRKYTENTITTPAVFKRELARVREQGYAVDDEEFEEGLRCVGVPVWDYSGKAVAALSVTGPATRMTKGRLPELIQSVMTAAADLSKALGHQRDLHNGPTPSSAVLRSFAGRRKGERG
jgi:DNA-binding IclR family transcriptional regulator